MGGYLAYAQVPAPSGPASQLESSQSIQLGQQAALCPPASLPTQLHPPVLTPLHTPPCLRSCSNKCRTAALGHAPAAATSAGTAALTPRKLGAVLQPPAVKRTIGVAYNSELAAIVSTHCLPAGSRSAAP